MSRPARVTGKKTLSNQERRVLDLVVEGWSNPEIAAELWLSRRTVQTHLVRIMAKTGARNRTQGAVMAVRGQIPPATGWNKAVS